MTPTFHNEPTPAAEVDRIMLLIAGAINASQADLHPSGTRARMTLTPAGYKLAFDGVNTQRICADIILAAQQLPANDPETTAANLNAALTWLWTAERMNGELTNLNYRAGRQPSDVDAATLRALQARALQQPS